MTLPLGGDSSLGGSSLRTHQVSSLSEQGRKAKLQTTLQPGEGTPFAAFEGKGLIARRGYARAWEQKPGPNGFVWGDVSNPEDVNAVVEKPEEHSRTIALSSDIPCVDHVSVVNEELVKKEITPRDGSLFIHALAVVIPNNVNTVLKGVKKGVVDIYDADDFEGLLKEAGGKPFWRDRATKLPSSHKGSKTSRRPAIEILAKPSVLSAAWIKNQLQEDQTVAPGFAPWLAGAALSSLQTSQAEATLKRLEGWRSIKDEEGKRWVHDGKSFIVKNDKNWYTFARGHKSGAPICGDVVPCDAFTYIRPGLALEFQPTSSASSKSFESTSLGNSSPVSTPDCKPTEQLLELTPPSEAAVPVFPASHELSPNYESFSDILVGPGNMSDAPSEPFRPLFGPVAPTADGAKPADFIEVNSHELSDPGLSFLNAAGEISPFCASEIFVPIVIPVGAPAPPATDDLSQLRDWLAMASPHGLIECARQAREVQFPMF